VVLPGGGPTVRGDGERTPRARCGRGRGQQQHSRASPRPGRARTIESSAYAPGGHRPSPPRVRARTHATMGPLCPPGTGPNTTRHAGARPLLLLLRAPGAHRLEELCRRALCRTDFRHWFRTTHQKHTPVVSTSARQASALPAAHSAATGRPHPRRARPKSQNYSNQFAQHAGPKTGGWCGAPCKQDVRQPRSESESEHAHLLLPSALWQSKKNIFGFSFLAAELS